MASNSLSFKEVETLHEYFQTNKITCKCGHRVFVTKEKGRIICSWCGNYVYRDKKQEFRERLEHARRSCK